MALFQLRGDLLQHLDGDGESDPLPGGIHRGVDAHHRPAGVEQRAARIAGIDRRVRLDEVVVTGPAGGVHVAPALVRDDSGGDRAREPEGVADGDHPLPDLEAFAVAQGEDRVWTALDLHQGQVRRLVLPDKDAADRPFVVPQLDGDLGRSRDHVSVGRQQAVGPDEEAGPEPSHRLFALAARPINPLQEVVERVARVAARGYRDDAHHRRHGLPRELGNRLRRGGRPRGSTRRICPELLRMRRRRRRRDDQRSEHAATCPRASRSATAPRAARFSSSVDRTDVRQGDCPGGEGACRRGERGTGIPFAGRPAARSGPPRLRAAR